MKLQATIVSYQQLLLDPENPRLATRFIADDGLDVSDPVSCQAKIEEKFKVPPSPGTDQRDTDRLLSIGEKNDDNEADDDFFSIKDLKDSMRRIGFVGIQSIIVRPHGETGKFIVLEGNRRVAAIRSVIREHEGAIVGGPSYIDDVGILESLKSINVMVFDTEDRTEKQIRDEISTMLGLRHYGSQLTWELLPRAKNIYDEYMRLSKGERFSYTSGKAASVAATLAINQAEVKKLLRGYISYKQLAIDYGVKPWHFSLILAAVEATGLQCPGNEYFEVDKKTFELLGDTPEKIENVCEFSNRDAPEHSKMIKDPKQFNKLGQIYKDSRSASEDSIRGMAESFFSEVVSRQISLDDAYTKLLAFKKRQKWIPELNKLLEKQSFDEESGGKLSLDQFVNQGQELKHFEVLESLIKRFVLLADLDEKA